MSVQSPLQPVLRGLSSDETSVRNEAIQQTALLLEQEHSYASYEHVLQRKSWLRTLPADYAVTRPGAIRQQYADLLPESLLGSRLEEVEADALVAALLALLDRGMATPSVIFALGKSMRPELIPRVTAELRKLVQGDGGFVIQQTIWTLSDLLYLPSRGRLFRKREVVFRDACAAIASVRWSATSSAGRGYVPDPREAAVATLSMLCDRFASPKRGAGLPRRRQTESALVCAVSEVEATSIGDIAIFGPLRADYNIDLQCSAFVRQRHSRPLTATWVGRYFDLRRWPPRMGVLLRGVSIDDLAPGTLVSAAGTEAAAISHGMAVGRLESRETFGEVCSIGLPDDVLMVLFRAPEEVALPLPEPDPQRARLREQFEALRQEREQRRARAKNSAQRIRGSAASSNSIGTSGQSRLNSSPN